MSGKPGCSKDLLDTFARLTGFDGRIVWDTRKPNGQPRRTSSLRRAQERVGFVSATPFEEGLARTIDWYRTISATQSRGTLASDAGT